MIGGIAFLIYDGLRTSNTTSIPPRVQPTDNPTRVVVQVSTDIPLPTSTPTAAPVPETLSLLIPSLAINAPVIDVYLVDGIWDVSLLGANVGHLQGTARVGEAGNVVLSGHVELRDGTKGVFGFLDQANIGDRIIVRRGNIQYQYVVTDVYVTTPDDLTPVYPTSTPRLTLITCGNYDFFSNQYLERTIVVAEPIG
jgi:sortase A